LTFSTAPSLCKCDTIYLPRLAANPIQKPFGRP
jgi:hypothetical protein